MLLGVLVASITGSHGRVQELELLMVHLPRGSPAKRRPSSLMGGILWAHCDRLLPLWNAGLMT